MKMNVSRTFVYTELHDTHTHASVGAADYGAGW